MRLSVFRPDIGEFETDRIEEVRELTWEQIPEVIRSQPWAPGIFRAEDYVLSSGKARSGMHRAANCFEYMDLMVADFDGGCTLDQARELFKDYRCIIGTTRHHQKPKVKASGKVEPACDRFRVVIPFERPVTSDPEYKANWFKFREIAPALDSSCKDTSRFYWPCADIVASWDGKPFPVLNAEVSPPTAKRENNWTVVGGQKGWISKRAQKFELEGAPDGQWHNELINWARECKQANIPEEQAIARGSVVHTFDDSDLFQIHDIYNRPIKHGPRPFDTSSTPTRSILLPNAVEQEKQYDEQLRAHREAVKNAIPFICEAFEGKFRLTRGLTLLCAKTGQSKTTTSCNVIARFFLSCPGKQALVITNESRLIEYANRIACIIKKVSWKDFYEDKLKVETRTAIENDAKKLLKLLLVVDSKQANTSELETVQAYLDDAKNRPEIGLIVVDYAQKIHESTAVGDQKEKPFVILKRFSDYLKNYGNECTIPVVVLAQLGPKTNINQDISSRIQGDHTFANDAEQVLEVAPNYETGLTQFFVHKTRDPIVQLGEPIIALFTDGRYVKPTQEELDSIRERIESKEAKKEKQKVDSVSEFMKEFGKTYAGSTMLTSFVFEEYVRWCKKQKLPKVGEAVLKVQLVAMGLQEVEADGKKSFEIPIQGAVWGQAGKS